MGWTQVAISAAGCAGQLALAIVALRRSGRSGLALLLALLFLDIFAWNLATLLEQMSGGAAWGFLDHTLSPLTAPLALEFVLAFVGRQRSASRWRPLWWIPFALLSLAPLAGVFSPAWHEWDRRGPWAAALAACGAAVMAWAIALLFWHLRHTDEPHERARTRLILVATLLGTALGLTDLLDNFIRELPSLASLGFLLAGAIIFVATVRERLLDSELSLEGAASALALAAAGLVVDLALFHWLASNFALLMLAVGVVTLALLAAMRSLSVGAAARRARTTELATLGRFAAQMAHDLKNPLAALKGAAQILRDDDGTRRAKFVPLMLEQIARLEESLDAYHRLAKMEPLLARVQINELVQEVIALQPFAVGQRISLQAQLGDGLPPCDADRGLLANALQNLIRNSCEAIDGDGVITLRTSSARGRVVICVEDNGQGMDARTRERATDEFFSTKAAGSGLGLSFVRRVAEAHGGSVLIESQLRRGTVVSLQLPLSRGA